MQSLQKPPVSPDNAKDVWILGAGFSKHICHDMPLISELAEIVNDIVVDRFDSALVLNNLELALSELRSDAPWKSAVDKYRDMVLYEQILERLQNALEIPYGTLDS